MTLRRKARDGRGDFIDGRFMTPPTPAGALDCVSPADLGDRIGSFPFAAAQIAGAVDAARRALPGWRRSADDTRATMLRAYAKSLEAHRQELTIAISRSIGKPLWESKTEVDAMIAKVEITLTAGRELIRTQTLDAGAARVRYRPVGVCAVIGPFNFPGHLPNGHIVPALAAGNTVVFKPSERAPEVGEIVARCLAEAGLPAGVFNVVQGDATVARALIGHADIDAVMFTGSTAVGRAILEASTPWPGRLIALELGGKNSAIVLDDADLAWAAREIAFAAYVTAGQRCTATSRVIVQRSVADALVAKLTVAARDTRIGVPDGDDVFLGPVISEPTRARALRAIADASAELDAIVPARIPDVPVQGHYLAPSLYRVREAAIGRALALSCDELFAPVLTVEIVDDEVAAIARTNDTPYGLAACVFTRSRERYERVSVELDVGLCNWNRGTVGSSSKLPFGGVKASGNHRPAGLFSTNYCVDAVGEILVEAPNATAALPPGLRVG